MAENRHVLAIEGPDGIGKTTVVRKLSEMMRDRGLEAVCVRAPGATSTGQQLREIILDNAGIDPYALTHLFCADFALSAEEIIVPALREQKTVIFDRFLISTLVYQYLRYSKRERNDAVIDLIQREQHVLIQKYGLLPRHIVLYGIPLDVLNSRIDRRDARSGFEYDLDAVVRGYSMLCVRGFMDPAPVVMMNMLDSTGAVRSSLDVATEILDRYVVP